MNKVKITSKGWHTYSSHLCGVKFHDGVSVEPLNDATINRLAATITIVRLDEEGVESPAGAAYDLIAASAARAPVLPKLMRQSDAEAAAEAKRDLLSAEKAPHGKMYSHEELQAVVDAEGLKGLRVIGDAWGVKHRNINVLIQMILREQSDFVEKRKQHFERINDKIQAAIDEQKIAQEAARKKAKAEADELEQAASILQGADHVAKEYAVGEIILTGEAVIEAAWKRSGMSATGWNKTKSDQIAELIANELKLIGVEAAKPEVPSIPVVPVAPVETVDERAQFDVSRLPALSAQLGSIAVHTNTIPDAEPVVGGNIEREGE
ncbi:hypothetical protein [Phyllobacterium myrsinacearum]|uniref:Uncharacterized protein n=1 Tax=Phyllobacterium myrsinacearum TaxID=28101 RepID=A0A839ESE1_9HYPH|nr:hypothetical protein [Phyllobacterium myrsinacearum]MBA8881722.1 hypothetical protein [Phyllobacterium myrsinacearum]